MGTFRGWLTISAGAFVTATVGISLPVAYLGGVCLDLPSGSASALIQGSQTISGPGSPLSRAGRPDSERTHMHRILPSLFTATFALAFFGMVQANQTALAQGPDKRQQARRRPARATCGTCRTEGRPRRSQASSSATSATSGRAGPSPCSRKRAARSAATAGSRAARSATTTGSRTTHSTAAAGARASTALRGARLFRRNPRRSRSREAPAARTLRPSRALGPSRECRQPISNVARFASVFSEPWGATHLPQPAQCCARHW